MTEDLNSDVKASQLKARRKSFLKFWAMKAIGIAGILMIILFLSFKSLGYVQANNLKEYPDLVSLTVDEARIKLISESFRNHRSINIFNEVNLDYSRPVSDSWKSRTKDYIVCSQSIRPGEIVALKTKPQLIISSEGCSAINSNTEFEKMVFGYSPHGPRLSMYGSKSLEPKF